MLKNLYSEFLSLLLKSVLTAITASAILTIFIYLVTGDKDVIIVDTFFLYIIYSFPLILIAGFIADVLIKRILKLFYSSNNFILWKFLINIFYAILLSFVLLMIFNNDNLLNLLLLLKSFLLVGFTACIYYMLSNLIYRFKNSKKNTL